MYRILLVVVVLSLPAVGYAQIPGEEPASASDDTAPEPTPPPEPVDEWVEVNYYRSLGPFMDSELFRFDARNEFPDESWLAVELRWNVRTNFLNERLIRAGMGIVYERYTLEEERSERDVRTMTHIRVHSVLMRQYFVRRPGKMVQPHFALEAGVAFENSHQRVKDEASGYFTDVLNRDRMLFRWGVGYGARVRLIPQAVLTGEVRLPFYVSRTVTPGIQFVVGVGVSY